MDKSKAIILIEEFEKASPEVQEACLKFIRQGEKNYLEDKEPASK